MRSRTLTAAVVLLFIGVGWRGAGAEVISIPMDKQINVGLGNAIRGVPNDQTPAGVDRITFENELGVGFTRLHLVADNGMNDWYDGPFVDLVLAGIGPIDLSKPGASIAFDTRYYQDPSDYPPGTPWVDHDAPIGLYLKSDGGSGIGWREFAYPYHSMWGDPPYPTWTHLELDANALSTPKVNVIDYPGLDMSHVVGLGFFGTNWPGLGNDFVDVKAVTITTEPVPEPASLLLFGTGLVGLRAWRKRGQ